MIKSLTNWECTTKLNLDIHIGFTYTVTNLSNNKIYAGSKFIINSRTNRYDPTWKYYKTSSKYVKSDIELLGENMFKFKIHACYTTYSELHSNEIKLIKKYLKIGNCYNKNVGGRIIMDDEVVAKIQATFLKNGHPMKGKVHPNKGKHINSGHHLNKGKKYFNNGIINKIEFSNNIDLSIWKPGMVRYQKTPISVINRHIKNISTYDLSPKYCPICSIKITFEKCNLKTCGNKECIDKFIRNHHNESFKLTGRGFNVQNNTEVFITPKGIYKSVKDAAIANNVSCPTVRVRCKNNNHIVKYNSSIPKDWNGKSWKELGWNYQQNT